MEAIRCRKCNKKAMDILEYKVESKTDNMPVEEWVKLNDGTYDEMTNTVVCTSCYVLEIMYGM